MASTTTPSSRDSERWVGQLPDGSWAVALFNRADPATPQAKSIDFADIFGVDGPADVRDLWAHKDLGSMTSYQASLGPHSTVLLRVVPSRRSPFQAEVGAWSGSAGFGNTFKGYTGMGYVTGLTGLGSGVGVGIEVHHGGSQRLHFRAANATGKDATMTIRALDPQTGKAHGDALLQVPHTPAWKTWQSIPVDLNMAAGTNLVVCRVETPGQGGINLDSISIA